MGGPSLVAEAEPQVRSAAPGPGRPGRDPPGQGPSLCFSRSPGRCFLRRAPQSGGAAKCWQLPLLGGPSLLRAPLGHKGEHGFSGIRPQVAAQRGTRGPLQPPRPGAAGGPRPGTATGTGSRKAARTPRESQRPPRPSAHAATPFPPAGKTVRGRTSWEPPQNPGQSRILYSGQVALASEGLSVDTRQTGPHFQKVENRRITPLTRGLGRLPRCHPSSLRPGGQPPAAHPGPCRKAQAPSRRSWVEAPATAPKPVDFVTPACLSPWQQHSE